MISGRRVLLAAGVTAAVLTAGTLVLIAWMYVGPAPRELGKPTIVLFGGDMAFGLSYQDQGRARGEEHILEQRGYQSTLRGLEPFLERADFTVLNLETVLTSQREVLHEDKAYTHYDHPEMSARSLQRNGIDAVSLANNHTLDFGASGLAETLAALKSNQIDAFGAGQSSSEAGSAYLVRLPGGGRYIGLAVIGVFEFRRSYHEKYRFYASPDRPGAAVLDAGRVRREIERVRREAPGAIVVVFPHWGRNYVWRNDPQKEAGRALIDAGADIVIGHGAHTLQEIEFYKDRLILYSIGNFMFNTRGRYHRSRPPPLSLVTELRLSTETGRLRGDIRLYPIASDNLKTDYRPRPATGVEFALGMSELGAKSLTAFLGRSPRIGEDDIGRYLEFRDVIERPTGASDRT